MVADLSTDKSVYDYGETIVITLRLSNPTSEVVQFEHSCPPLFLIDDFQLPIICVAGDPHYYGPGSWRTWTVDVRPSEYGLPTSSGQHTIIGSYYIYADTLVIEAPKYIGGQIYIEFLSGTAPADIDAIRQSLNGVVIDSNVRSNGNLTETWEITGTTIEDAIAQHQGNGAIVSILPSFPIANYLSVDVDYALSMPRAFTLSQNYPNPFNPETIITFSIAQVGQLQLSVYNILGELIETLEDRVFPAGEYATTFDATGLGSGIYFYTLTAEDFTQTRKMVVLK